MVLTLKRRKNKPRGSRLVRGCWVKGRHLVPMAPVPKPLWFWVATPTRFTLCC